MQLTVDEFLSLLETYNASIWPAQVVVYAAAVLAIGFVVKSSRLGNQIISGILGGMWLGTGLVFHMLTLSTVDKTAFISGAFFLLQGLMLIWLGTVKREVSFRLRWDAYGIVATLLALYALLAYPVFGPLAGHVYPRAPVFSLMPCPVTLFTFAFFLWAEPGFSRALLMIPFVAAIVSLFGALSLQLPEDLPVLPAALVASLMIIHRERMITVNRLKAAKAGL
jgi:hypothetical protein